MSFLSRRCGGGKGVSKGILLQGFCNGGGGNKSRGGGKSLGLGFEFILKMCLAEIQKKIKGRRKLWRRKVGLGLCVGAPCPLSG